MTCPWTCLSVKLLLRDLKNIVSGAPCCRCSQNPDVGRILQNDFGRTEKHARLLKTRTFPTFHCLSISCLTFHVAGLSPLQYMSQGRETFSGREKVVHRRRRPENNSWSACLFIQLKKGYSNTKISSKNIALRLVPGFSLHHMRVVWNAFLSEDFLQTTAVQTNSLHH